MIMINNAISRITHHNLRFLCYILYIFPHVIANCPSLPTHSTLKSNRTIDESSSLIDPIQADHYFAGEHVQFILVARTDSEFQNLFPTIISLLITHPISEINVLIPNLTTTSFNTSTLFKSIDIFDSKKKIHIVQVESSKIRDLNWKAISPLNLNRQYTIYIDPCARIFGSQLINRAAFAMDRTFTNFVILDSVLITKTKNWMLHVAKNRNRIEILLNALTMQQKMYTIRSQTYFSVDIDIMSLPNLQRIRLKSHAVDLNCIDTKIKVITTNKLWKVCGSICQNYFNKANNETLAIPNQNVFNRIEKVNCNPANLNDQVCKTITKVNVDGGKNTFVCNSYEDAKTAACGFSWHFKLEEQHHKVVSVLSSMIDTDIQQNTFAARNIIVLREQQKQQKQQEQQPECEILIISLDRKAFKITGIHDIINAANTNKPSTNSNFLIDVVFDDLKHCQIVAQKDIGHVNENVIRSVEASKKRTMIFLAATLSMEGGATIGDIRSDRSQILYRIMNAANLLRKMNVNHLGLFLLRDEFLTIPMSIVDMFDIVLRHHYGRNEINHSSRVMWLPLGWDPGYVQKTDTFISYIPASKRKYLVNWIGNIHPRLFISRLNTTIINPSRRKLQDTLDEYQKQNIEKNIFLHSNDYYAGWDSVHLRQKITHTHMSLTLFKQTLEQSTFTVIPCSINTIDAARFYEALESHSIPILEGPIEIYGLPLSFYLPNDPHPFPVVQHGKWDLHLTHLIDHLLAQGSNYINALQQNCQIWWKKFKTQISNNILSAIQNELFIHPKKSQSVALQQQSLSLAANHAFTHLDLAFIEYDQKNYRSAIKHSLKALYLEFSNFDESSGTANAQFIEALLLIGQSKFNLAYSKESKHELDSWSNVVHLMKDAKSKIEYGLQLTYNRSPQILKDALHDTLLLQTEIFLFMMEWQNALVMAKEALKYLPTSSRALDIIGIATWRINNGDESSDRSSSDDSIAENLRIQTMQHEIDGQNRWKGIELDTELFCLWRNVSCKSYWHIGANGKIRDMEE